MKKIFSSALAIVLTASACLAQATSSISFTNTSPASSAFPNTNLFVDLSLGKFDTGLGTLNSVVVTVNFVQAGGSFTVTRPTNNLVGVSLTNAGVWATIRQAPTNNLGFAQIGQTTNMVGTSITNVSLPFSIPLGNTQLFSLANTNILVGITTNISSGFWSAYQSAGGVGSVVFQFQNRPATYYTSTSGARSVNATNFIATANMTVTYNFTPTAPIPEPGTWAVGSLLLGGAAYRFLRRRHLTACDPPAAA